MVQRASHTGRIIGPDEALTVEQALAAYTLGGAHACRREHLQGSLTAGKLADLVVLADDPAQVDPSRIADVEVLATYVGGHPAHSTSGW
ncbi:MAG TPA: amidohydrolase family protein [Pseudonocardiaceae bacterium]|nr:amidohydrolase family protein [Pseudonocardiaceae bacterium]